MFSEFFTYCFMHVTYSMVWSFNNCNKKCFKNCIEKLRKKATAVIWELLRYSCINYSYKSNMYDGTSYKMSISGFHFRFCFNFWYVEITCILFIVLSINDGPVNYSFPWITGQNLNQTAVIVGGVVGGVLASATVFIVLLLYTR